ncbi:hypothetical protein J3458_004986 [Metarhizium acridum]|uniref:uncharacterized protein n=1 Tax=Metarhizium acridum TaxID=92637 RepID=UPI001C6C31AF|nr:hypothetical protein J3458_004986 [Metarhizium acridum]
MSLQKLFDIEEQVVVSLGAAWLLEPGSTGISAAPMVSWRQPGNSRLIKVHVWGLRFAAYGGVSAARSCNNVDTNAGNAIESGIKKNMAPSIFKLQVPPGIFCRDS